MKVRKAIKTIAALGVGATFVGATIMGAMAADLKDYPSQFITDGKFNGLLVVGANANAIDTFGVTNVALGLQKAAVTKTLVCGTSATGSTSVTGEKVELKSAGNDLNLNDTLKTVQAVALDDSDLPNLLATETFKDNQGTNKEDVDYDQTLTVDPDGLAKLNYYQDDTGAANSGVYLKFQKNKDMYTYSVDFKSDLDYADGADLEATTITLQGKPYTITKVNLNSNGKIDKLTMLSGQTVQWIEQGQSVTKVIGGTSHTITMTDVTESDTTPSCGFTVDGTSVWIDQDDTDRKSVV